MSKSKLDILVLTGAFFLGMLYSLTHNPLTGLSLLIGVITLWVLIPKLPQLIKAKVHK